MAATRFVDFNALPRTVRERLVACLRRETRPEPILADIFWSNGPTVWWIFLGITSGLVALVAGLVFMNQQRSDSPAVVVTAVAIALLVLSVFGVVRRVQLHRSLPWEPGRYLLPMDLVDARNGMLRLVPLSTLSDIRAVHHYYNGSYGGTGITFTLDGYVRETFSVHSKHFAESSLNTLREWQAFIRRSIEHNDLNAIHAFDPFFEVRMENSWSRPTPALVEGPTAKPLAPIFRGHVMLGVAALSGVLSCGLLFCVHRIATIL